MQPPEIAWDANPQHCIKVNASWVSYVCGLLERASKAGFWDADEQAGIDGILAIQNAFAISNCEECPDPMTYKLDTVICAHREAAGTNGGATVANSWQDLPLNAILQDTTGEAFMVGNKPALPAGLWSVEVEHVFIASGTSTTRFRLAYIGQGKYGDVVEALANAEAKAKLYHVIDTPSAWLAEYSYYASAARPVGLGIALNFGAIDEYYGLMRAIRLTQLP